MGLLAEVAPRGSPGGWLAASGGWVGYLIMQAGANLGHVSSPATVCADGVHWSGVGWRFGAGRGGGVARERQIVVISVHGQALIVSLIQNYYGVRACEFSCLDLINEAAIGEGACVCCLCIHRSSVVTAVQGCCAQSVAEIGREAPGSGWTGLCRQQQAVQSGGACRAGTLTIGRPLA